MTSVYHKFTSPILIVFIILAFFSNLFYPKLSLFSTPDFGESDIWQLNLPNKYFLSQSFKNGEFPLWNPYIGNGFPQLAEGQIGTFNLINLLFFRFLPFVTAYNLGYIVIFLTTAIGTFLYCRTIRISNIGSVLAALLFTFSGTFITHISHYNLIQAASFLPWLFYSLEKLLTDTRLKWGILFSLILSQQIFSGFPQLVFISLIGLIIYFLFMIKSYHKQKKLLLSILITIFVILGFTLSAVQLLPQKEFLDTSTRAAGFSSQTATMFSYPFKHLITFIFPYQLGDPRKGTYPSYTVSDGSIFWENTGYIGVIPLILALLSLKLIKKNKKVSFYILLLFVALLLMTGKYSPFYFLFPIPPFSYFRVPSRFIFLFVWSLVILVAFGFDYLFSYIKMTVLGKNMLLINFFKLSILLFSLFQIFDFARNYNPILPQNTLLKPPEVLSSLKANDKFFSFGSGTFWNKIFLRIGWQNINDYLPFKNALFANQNTIYQVPSINAYRAQNTKRYETVQNVLDNISVIDNAASSSSTVINLLKLFNVNHIITPYEIGANSNFKKIREIPNFPSLPKFKVYELENVRPRIYITDKNITVPYIPDIFQKIGELNDNSGNLILLENDIPLSSASGNLNYQSTDLRTSPQKVSLRVNANKDAILVYNNSFYPGWQATVNSLNTKIFPVNLNQMGFIVKKGTNNIEISYEPNSFKIGKIVTLGSFIAIFVIFVISLLL